MPLEIVEPRRLYRLVAGQLRGLIDKGEFPAGARLPTERELAEQLQVSRPTVREALIALEVEGRVRIRVGSGIYVLARPNPAAVAVDKHDGPFEILGARALFEGAVAAEAATHVRTDQIAEMSAILGRMGAADPIDESQQIALDRAFHVAVATVLDNAVVTRMVGELFDLRITPYFERLACYFENPDSWRAAVAEHRAVLAGLAAHDGVAAGEAMRTHLRLSRDRFSRSFGELPPDKKDRRATGGNGRPAHAGRK